MAALSAEQKCKLLAQVPLFSTLSDRELADFAAGARSKTLGRRKELFHKGDEGSELYVVVSGQLKALSTSLDGDDLVFSIMGPGEVFGELALFLDTERTATITAIEDSELLVIHRRDLLAFIKRHPDAAVTLMEVLARRAKKLSEMLEDSRFLNIHMRLAKKITVLARAYGNATPEGLRVDLKLSQEEWGDLVGATRESTNKQIRAWTREGIISVDAGYIIIHKLAELEELADALLQ